MRMLLVAAFLFPVYCFAAPVSYVFSGHIEDINFSPPGLNAQLGDAFSGTLTYDAHYNGTWNGNPWPANKAALLEWSVTIPGGTYSLYESPASPASNPFFSGAGSSVSINSMFKNTPGLPGFDNAGLVFNFGALEFGHVIPDQLPVDLFTGGGISFAGISGSPGAGFSGTIETLTAVPLPTTAWLFGSSLLGLLGMARRSK